MRLRVTIVLAVLATVIAAGTIGYHLLEGWPWLDAFYMTLITLTTVGYGEVLPLSDQGRMFNSVLMIAGVTVTFTSIALLAELIIKLELADFFGRRRRIRMFEGLSNHYIVCGAGRVGRHVVEELLRSNVSVVVIDNDEGHAKWATDRKIPTIIADATRDDRSGKPGSMSPLAWSPPSVPTRRTST